jgi:hypothetical protein
MLGAGRMTTVRRHSPQVLVAWSVTNLKVEVQEWGTGAGMQKIFRKEGGARRPRKGQNPHPAKKARSTRSDGEILMPFQLFGPTDPPWIEREHGKGIFEGICSNKLERHEAANGV